MSEEQRGERWSAERGAQVIALHSAKRGPLLVILQALQETFGYIDEEAIPLVAEALNLSHAEVYGVKSFYRDFRDVPAGRSVIRVCRAESCQAMGADRLVAHAVDRLGIALGDTTPDGAHTLEQVFCLGNCALAPAVMLDGHLLGRVDEDRFDSLISGGGALRP